MVRLTARNDNYKRLSLHSYAFEKHDVRWRRRWTPTNQKYFLQFHFSPLGPLKDTTTDIVSIRINVFFRVGYSYKQSSQLDDAISFPSSQHPSTEKETVYSMIKCILAHSKYIVYPPRIYNPWAYICYTIPLRHNLPAYKLKQFHTLTRKQI